MKTNRMATTYLRIISYIIGVSILSIIIFSIIQMYLIEGETPLEFCFNSKCFDYFTVVFKEPLSNLSNIFKIFPALAFIVAARTYLLNVRSASITNKSNLYKELTSYLDSLNYKKIKINEIVNYRTLFRCGFDMDNIEGQYVSGCFLKVISELEEGIKISSKGYGVANTKFVCQDHINKICATLNKIGVKPNIDVGKRDWPDVEKDLLSLIDNLSLDWFSKETNLTTIERAYTVAFS